MTPDGYTNGSSNAPWWIRFLYSFGIPAALSVYLIWLMASRLEGKIDNLGEQWRIHNAETDYHGKLAASQLQLLQDIRTATLRWCVNAAESQTDRNACFEYVAVAIPPRPTEPHP